MKRVFMDMDHCIGCKLCELACLTVHSKSKDLILAYTVERAEGLMPHKRVFREGALCASIGCRHCDEPACVTACISGALTKDPVSGRTLFDADKCVGCWSCYMACPFGAIQRNEETHKIDKCDRCLERDTPACVAACPNQALTYEDR
ncbi:MAG: 4Fe-4S dicluster domain-containing protein [Desulfovibrionaceae bacterium]